MLDVHVRLQMGRGALRVYSLVGPRGEQTRLTLETKPTYRPTPTRHTLFAPEAEELHPRVGGVALLLLGLLEDRKDRLQTIQFRQLHLPRERTVRHAKPHPSTRPTTKRDGTRERD